MIKAVRRRDLIYPELSYKIVGILFEIFKELGGSYQEKYYQRAVANELKRGKVKFKEQVSMPLYYKQEKIGLYYFDFLIDDKMVLEIKKDKNFSRKNTGLIYKRIINVK